MDKQKIPVQNWMQQIYALAFLVIYTLLTAAMIFIIYQITKESIDLPTWAVSLVSSIWGGMNVKVSTITDYFFGSSQGSRDKDDKLKIQE